MPISRLFSVLALTAALTVMAGAGAASEGRDHVLSQAVQHVGDIKITLTRIESNSETITVYFEVLNEGAATSEIALAGPGYNRNGTYLMAGGRKIVARQIAIAGFYSRSYLKTEYAPGIAKSGLLVFEGWDGEAGDIAYLQLFVRGKGYRRIQLDYFVQP
ncbi:hypothetical protein [Asticcacaulis sp. AC402]|uniref:hypothetical protein n=1 Tax=Asticcacaulis sp. AC402 TaxID=1282361 RepID=UPI0003C4092F|nr:hypothetical protein [Asticcacaulis sp. AC402]ESQ74262.1 hypothetical protein ABAC402_14950 [Asticcacaulis sp. AC402]